MNNTKKYIDTIEASVPYTNEDITINLDGKDLILVGKNGCGKTSLLKEIYEKLSFLILNKNFDRLDQEKKILAHWENELKNHSPGTLQHAQAKEQFRIKSAKVNQISGKPLFSFNNSTEFSRLVDEEIGLIEFFPATRQSKILEATSASGTNYDKGDLKSSIPEKKPESQLERHLVNLRTRRAYALTEKPDQELAHTINI